MRAPILALLVCVAPLLGQDAPVARGFEHFYNLEFDEALADFRLAANLNPGSPDLRNHIAQTLVFREMFRNGALESELVSGANSFLRRPKLNPSPETEKLFLDEIAAAVSLAEARLKANPKDTAALYALGVSYGLRSSYFWVVKKSWRDSLRDATTARQYHNRVSELDPSNVDARLVQGLHDYTVGSLPLMYRMVGFLVGIHGDREKGIRTIQDVAQHGKGRPGGRQSLSGSALQAREQAQAGRSDRAGIDRALPAQFPAAAGVVADVQHGRRLPERIRRAGRDHRPQEERSPGAYDRIPLGKDLVSRGHDPVLVQGPGSITGEHAAGGSRG